MKYKYLKGSEKDFEGAPEWCTHVSESDGGLLAWEQADVTKMGNRYQWCDGSIIEGIYVGSGSPLDIIAERQPITEPSWDGVGLPPVGCECEFSWTGNEFKRGVLLFASKQTVVIDAIFEGSAGDTEQCYYLEDMKFRPLRSEADKKRDAALLAMNIAVNEGESGVIGGVVAIYDAIASGKIPGVKLED